MGGRIRILPPLLAQKIAAGEVIERPQSVVRELIDNALDSGANELDLMLQQGGNDLIVVQDNGSGMTRDDLALCWQPHATSKLHEEADLYQIRTMGFRGEALSSIASVSRLTVFSLGVSEGGVLEVHGGSRTRLEAWAGRKGTRVEVASLFYNLPARLQFLKRAGSEFLLCKTTFLEKAAAHPGLSFRLFNDDRLALFLPAKNGEQALKERFLDIYRSTVEHPALLHQISASHPEATITMVLGRPELYQHDRKMIQVFVNRRRVNEFSLVQAIEAGYTGFLPGGRFPVAALFLDVDPARVDVNIHPAKREVKLMDNRRLHSQVVRMIQDFLRIDYHRRDPANQSQSMAPALPGFESGSAPVLTRSSAMVNYDLRQCLTIPTEVREGPRELENRDRPLIQPSPAHPAQPRFDTTVPGSSIRYLGQIFGVFLVAIHGERLILLDFHAAHERILFDRYRSNLASQALLVPLRLEPATGTDYHHGLSACVAALRERGIALRLDGSDWILEAVPLCFSGNTEILVEALESDTLTVDNLDRSLFASLACRAARKDGDLVTADQAQALLEEALALPEPRCPHGRPIWFSLSRDELFELVGRTV